MARKKKPKRKSSMKRARKPLVPVVPPRKPEDDFKTVGVRFIDGNDPYKLFTYQVRIGAPLHLGQELIADTPRGPKLCVAVRLDATYNPEEYPGPLKTITRRAAPL